MTANKKKIFITQTMSPSGRTLLTERDDIELVEFPNLISASDFESLLKEHAPVHGVALGATRFGEAELEAAGDMKVVTRIGVGYDAVDVAALSRRKVPLMVVGIGLALVYEHRQSLLASMAAHATFNLVGYVFIVLSRR